MIDIHEAHVVVEKAWTKDILDDFRNKRIRTEADLVASLYHGLRPHVDRHPELKLTLEKRLKGSDEKRVDLVMRRDWKWWVAFECKLDINSKPWELKKDLKSLLKSCSKKGAVRGYVCYLLTLPKKEKKTGLKKWLHAENIGSIEEWLQSFEDKLKGALSDIDLPVPDDYLWIARGVRISRKPRDIEWRDEFDETWRVFPFPKREKME